MNQTAVPVRVAVVTGGHGFDVPNFHQLFRALAPEVDAYIQHIDDFCYAPKAVRQGYDVVLFYIMMRATPADEGLPWYAGRQLSALQELGETPQGLVILHHALLAYPEWPLWGEVTGLEPRTFGYRIGETVTSRVLQPGHPITRGVQAWTMVDETYTMVDAGPDSDVLIAYDHPKSMRSIAWTRQYRSSRAFCYQAGHDNLTWAEPGFRQVLKQGILWSAGRLLDHARVPA